MLKPEQVTIVWDADLVNHFERSIEESNTTMLRELRQLIDTEILKRAADAMPPKLKSVKGATS